MAFVSHTPNARRQFMIGSLRFTTKHAYLANFVPTVPEKRLASELTGHMLHCKRPIRVVTRRRCLCLLGGLGESVENLDSGRQGSISGTFFETLTGAAGELINPHTSRAVGRVKKKEANFCLSFFRSIQPAWSLLFPRGST